MRKTRYLRASLFGIIMTGLVLAGMTVATPEAQAYKKLGCRFNHSTITWGNYSPTASIPYQSAWNNSISKWSSSTKVSFATSTKLDILFYPANWNNVGWDGMSPGSDTCSGGISTTGGGGYVYLNTYWADRYVSAKRESVIVHEIGHWLGLAHVGDNNTACSSVVVMHPYTDSRWDRCQVNTPKPDDINGVNALY